MRSALGLLLREIALTVLLFFSVSLGAALSGVDRPAPTGPGLTASPPALAPSEAAAAARALLFVCALAAIVHSWMILRSRFRGWKLVATVFLAVFGLGTVMPQIESAVFLSDHLPPDLVSRLFVMGAISAALFAPGAAWILGRARQTEATPAIPLPAGMKASEWIAKIAALALIYVALYFLAGYFIAFHNPELRAYYHDTAPGSFFTQMQNIWTRTPWLFGLQVFRGALWIAVVAPVIVSFQGRRFELAFLLASLFAVWFFMLLEPNPYMPESVRLSHLVETLSSQFLFGWLAGALLGQQR